ncbi:MAG: (2Fe-2S)-binding protein [Treponema sp.]|jgi:ferredoxin|nr:(2Fe-2S)-binding protein [Treponema sp.]
MSHKPDPNKSVNLTIDGIPVTVPEGTRILEAAKKANIKIPTLCEHPDLCKRAICRICVVECDGRGKLVAACANDVWEGVSVVTNNLRLLDIRKTIIELILSNHPQDCVSCVRNKKCELQTLSADFGIRESSFGRIEDTAKPVIESGTIVRNMDKCVKCGRCVEACQEEQTIRAINTSRRSHDYGISAPYKQSLEESPCVFCGRCAAVCPVGAIYEHDTTAEVWASINDGGRRTIAQISPELTLDGCGTGKIITALKQLGFDKVFDASVSEQISNSELNAELKQRLSAGGKGKLPMITGNIEGVYRFVNHFYPSLADHLAVGRNPRRIFSEEIRGKYAEEEKADVSAITPVSFVPGIAGKYGAGGKTDFALTSEELARMISLAGINIAKLAESSFDTVKVDAPKGGVDAQKEIVRGFAQARKVLETVLNGEFASQWIEIEV